MGNQDYTEIREIIRQQVVAARVGPKKPVKNG